MKLIHKISYVITAIGAWVAFGAVGRDDFAVSTATCAAELPDTSGLLRTVAIGFVLIAVGVTLMIRTEQVISNK